MFSGPGQLRGRTSLNAPALESTGQLFFDRSGSSSIASDKSPHAASLRRGVTFEGCHQDEGSLNASTCYESAHGHKKAYRDELKRWGGCAQDFPPADGRGRDVPAANHLHTSPRRIMHIALPTSLIDTVGYLASLFAVAQVRRGSRVWCWPQPPCTRRMTSAACFCRERHIASAASQHAKCVISFRGHGSHALPHDGILGEARLSSSRIAHPPCHGAGGPPGHNGAVRINPRLHSVQRHWHQHVGHRHMPAWSCAARPPLTRKARSRGAAAWCMPVHAHCHCTMHGGCGWLHGRPRMPQGPRRRVACPTTSVSEAASEACEGSQAEWLLVQHWRCSTG